VELSSLCAHKYMEDLNFSQIPSNLVGQRVEGLFDGGEVWYPGAVVEQINNTYTIQYDDGDVEIQVPIERIRLISTPPGDSYASSDSPRHRRIAAASRARLRLADSHYGKEKVKNGLRILVAGFAQFLIEDPGVILTEEQLMLQICNVVNKGCPTEKPNITPSLCSLEIHRISTTLDETAFAPLKSVVNFGDGRAKHKLLVGGKVRVIIHPDVMPINIPIEMRGVPIWVLEEFHRDFNGLSSREKLEDLLNKVPNGMSYVEWAMGEHSGAADYFISYSWDSDWRYMIACLKDKLGPNAKVWIDICCCSQHHIGEGEMDEIKLMPEIINFTGQVIIMPSAVERLWCNVEAVWSIDLNSQIAYSHTAGDYFEEMSSLTKGGGMQLGDKTECMSVSQGWRACVIVAKNAAAVKIHFLGDDPMTDEWVTNVSDRFKDDKLMEKIEARCAQDGIILTKAGTVLLDNAQWFKPTDEDHLRGMINNSLGGVTACVRKLKRYLKPQVAADTPMEIESDAVVLQDLYEYTGGNTSWLNDTGWLEEVLMEKPLSTWYGVRTNPMSQVVSLDLSSNALTGLIPPSLCELPRIRVLRLQNNQLEGDVPVRMFNLRGKGCKINLSNNKALRMPQMIDLGDTVKKLDLSHLSLPGEIPWNDFLGMENLQILRLNGNKFTVTAIPQELSQLQFLSELQLDGLALDGVLPCSVIRIKALGRCKVSINNIRDGLRLPDNLGDLGDDVKVLDLEASSLTGGIPESIGKLTKIRVINLSNNELRGPVPSSLRNCYALRELQLHGNMLTVPKDAALDDNGQMSFYNDGDVEAFFRCSALCCVHRSAGHCAKADSFEPERGGDFKQRVQRGNRKSRKKDVRGQSSGTATLWVSTATGSIYSNPVGNTDCHRHGAR